MQRTLYTMGYGKWRTNVRASQMVHSLLKANVTAVIDIRLAPCASSLSATSNYGPQPWNLQLGRTGIVALLEGNGIQYAWLVELGNPQKNDLKQAVLKEHIATKDDKWPVNRGLKQLKRIFDQQETCCLICACRDYNTCHRKTIAEAFNSRFFDGRLNIHDL